jgi:hypothetical protein
LIAEFAPCDGTELLLVGEIARAEWRLRLAELAQIARTRSRIEQAGDRESAEISRDLRWLFGPALGIRGAYAWEHDCPSALVARLEATVEGCGALIEGWRLIAKRVEEDLELQVNDRLKAIRMLGRRVIDAIDDECVRLILIASFVLHPQGRNHPFEDLRYEIWPPEREAILTRIRSLPPQSFLALDAKVAKQRLLELIVRNVRRLEAMLKSHADNAEERAASTAAMLAHDDTPEGARLARYKKSCERSIRESRAFFRRYRRQEHKLTAQGRPKENKTGAASKARQAGAAKVEARGFAMASARDIKNLTTRPNFCIGVSEAKVDPELHALTIAHDWALRAKRSLEK